MRLMMMAASLRKASYNKKLIHLAANLIRDAAESVDVFEFNDFDIPLYNADIQNELGFPPAVLKFCEHIQQADGLIFSVPEYNFSIPGVFKNLIDWVSRIDSAPWKNQHILLLSASPSLVGGNRSLWATRIPLETCGAFVYPDMFSLASADTAFNEEGELNDQSLQKRLLNTMQDYVNIIKKLK